MLNFDKCFSPSMCMILCLSFYLILVNGIDLFSNSDLTLHLREYFITSNVYHRGGTLELVSEYFKRFCTFNSIQFNSIQFNSIQFNSSPPPTPLLREKAQVSRLRVTKREKESNLKTPQWTLSPTWSSIPKPWDHDLSWNQGSGAYRMSHPGTLCTSNF